MLQIFLSEHFILYALYSHFIDAIKCSRFRERIFHQSRKMTEIIIPKKFRIILCIFDNKL